MKARNVLIGGTIALAAVGITGCTAADVASRNTSQADGQFKKHYLGLSDNTIWTATQLDPHKTSEFRTRIIYRPTAVVPDLDLSVGI